MKHKLIIRADANSRIGTGHVMRCIALGQAWQDKDQRSEVGSQRSDGAAKVVFITCCDNDLLLQRLRNENFTVVELKNPNEFLSRLTADLRSPTSAPWLVLDGYPFTIEDQRAIRQAGCKLLVIDDCNHLPQYECDILLNQNINASELDYSINPEAQLLLGPRFVLLRREFQSVDAVSPPRPDGGERGENTASAKRLLVTMGGADPDNVSLKLIHALQQLNNPELNVNVVVGPANPHQSSLETAVRDVNIQLINSADMAELMRWADFAISAAGSTCWELLSIGTPFATVILADNQEGVARYLNEQAGIHCFGWVDDSFERDVANYLQEIYAEGLRPSPTSIDGQGAGRVVEMLRNDPAQIPCSAVVPVYNAEPYLVPAIDSLLAQTVPFEKIILVDDGSTDGSVQLIQNHYQSELDAGQIVLHIQPENGGVSKARNLGVSLVETDWFVFLDADDVLMPNAAACLLSKAKELLDENDPYHLIHPAYRMIDDAGEVTSPVHRWRQVGCNETLGWMFYRNHIISPSGLLVNRQRFIELGGFNESMRYSEDADLWLRFASVSGIGYVDQPLALIRRHATNASKQVANMLNGELTILRKYSFNAIKQAIMQRDCSPEKNSADLVSILYRLDEWEAGFQEATQAKVESPEDPGLNFFTGLYWLKKTNYERALTDFLLCEKTPNPNGAVLNNIGAIYCCLGEKDKAAGYLDRALELHPNYMDASINKDCLQPENIEPDALKFTWRELRPTMISYSG